MLTLVIDTNILLQCRPLADLNWLDLDPTGVRIVVPVTALGEIDQAKSSGNSRRAKKAREVSSMFSAALDVGAERTEIAGCQNCTWEFASGSTTWHESLDRDIKDHRMIAEALDLATWQEPVAFLTADILARLSAMRAGVRVIKLPPDWLLAPEPDARDKRLSALEVRIAAMEKVAPNVRVTVERNGVLIVGEVQGAFEYHEEPEEELLDDLIKLLEKRHPRAMTFSVDALPNSAAMLGVRRQLPTEDDFRTYRDKRYPQWLARSRKTLVRFAERCSRGGRLLKLSVVLNNVGAVPADGLIIKYSIHGGAQLLPPHEDDRKSVFELPVLLPPPQPPEVRLIYPLDDLIARTSNFPTPDLGFGSSRAHRDPHTFYWRDMPSDLSTSHELECEEFRHGRTDEFEVEILMPSTRAFKGALVCELSARNMQLVRHTMPISYKGDAIDVSEKLRELVVPVPTLVLRIPRKHL